MTNDEATAVVREALGPDYCATKLSRYWIVCKRNENGQYRPAIPGRGRVKLTDAIADVEASR